MRTLRKPWISILIVGLVIGGPVAWYKWPSSASAAESSILAPVKKGEFKVLVTSTGELRANKFVQVTGPAQAQSVNVYQTKIASIVPEGTVVKEGDVIAELDRGPAATKMSDVSLSLQKAQAEFTTAQLDSTLNLANSREDVRNAEYFLEEKKLARDQAQYEAPTLKRQAEIDYEKATRALEQSKRNLSTKTKQAEAKMSSVGADLSRQQNMLKNIQEVMGSFTIRAPSSGMVIYVREWNGKKKGVGSTWSPWEPGVATLPDLSQMESQTYINEVDVRKIAVGQKVQITLDADPSKKLDGIVSQIANVGEQRPNQDSKVFEVKVTVTKADTTLRPGMTTANAIEVTSVPNVLSVPLEAVVSEGGFSYVYKKQGGGVVKQMIEAGMTNENEVIVKQGVDEKDRVYLIPPEDKTTVKTEVIPGLKPVLDSAPIPDSPQGVNVPLSKAPLAAPTLPGDEDPAKAQGLTMHPAEVPAGNAKVSRARAMFAHLMFSGRTAAEAVGHNKLRASLTSLGILFGVASVIAMLAIGNGAEQEILAQMKLLGANNIVITPIIEQKEGNVEKDPKKSSKRFSPGLTWLDAQAIKNSIPDVSRTSSEVVINTVITREGRHRSGKVVGVDSSYFSVMNLKLARGARFSRQHFSGVAQVAVIGPGVAKRFFTSEDPVGSRVKVGNEWLTVVGVLEDRQVSEKAVKDLGIRDANMDVYVPLPTMLRRYRDRSQITQSEMELAARSFTQTDSSETDEQRAEKRNPHQLDKIIVQVDNSEMVTAVADVVRRMLQRRHNDVTDFEITVPELLLKQEQRTKAIFNVVLGAIASISLVVGGIGIMNIMLASILERIKEIGVRRAMGATQKDVLWQFLSEAVMISLAGGIAGIIVGGLLSYGIERFAKISTIVSPESVAVAFGVSMAVGLVFGIVPASRAAKQDPITCLRYE